MSTGSGYLSTSTQSYTYSSNDGDALQAKYTSSLTATAMSKADASWPAASTLDFSVLPSFQAVVQNYIKSGLTSGDITCGFPLPINLPSVPSSSVVASNAWADSSLIYNYYLWMYSSGYTGSAKLKYKVCQYVSPLFGGPSGCTNYITSDYTSSLSGTNNITPGTYGVLYQEMFNLYQTTLLGVPTGAIKFNTATGGNAVLLHIYF